MTNQAFSPRTSHRVVAFMMAALITVAVMGGVDLLATSAPPAGLVAQLAHLMPNG